MFTKNIRNKIEAFDLLKPVQKEEAHGEEVCAENLDTQLEFQPAQHGLPIKQEKQQNRDKMMV